MRFEVGKFLRSKATGNVARIEHVEVYIDRFDDDEITVELTLEFEHVVECVKISHRNRHDYEVVDEPAVVED